MAFTSTAGRAPAPVGFPSSLRNLAYGIGEFFAAMGAASRVATAVESRRDPSPEDLAILGIDGPLPRRR